jgi:hypothetical protein
MSFEDHFKTCPYCNIGLKSKPTIRVKSVSSCEKEKRRKLAQLGNIVKMKSYTRSDDVRIHEKFQRFNVSLSSGHTPTSVNKTTISMI